MTKTTVTTITPRKTPKANYGDDEHGYTRTGEERRMTSYDMRTKKTDKERRQRTMKTYNSQDEDLYGLKTTTAIARTDKNVEDESDNENYDGSNGHAGR